jgi:hypothetical protein
MHPLLSASYFIVVIPTSLALVTCVKVGAIATASWTNSASQACTWTGTVGSDFGMNPNGSEYVFFLDREVKMAGILLFNYSCNGCCGAGCTGVALGNA